MGNPNLIISAFTIWRWRFRKGLQKAFWTSSVHFRVQHGVWLKTMICPRSMVILLLKIWWRHWTKLLYDACICPCSPATGFRWVLFPFVSKARWDFSQLHHQPRWKAAEGRGARHQNSRWSSRLAFAEKGQCDPGRNSDDRLWHSGEKYWPEERWWNSGERYWRRERLRNSGLWIQLEVPWGWQFWYLLTPVSTPNQLEVPRAWKFWYLLTLVNTPSQLEVPWGWEFWYLLTLVSMPSQLEVPWGWEFWYLLTLVSMPSSIPWWACQVNLKFHGWEVLISSYPGEHYQSTWSSMGVGILISSYPGEHSKSTWSSMGVGILISSYPGEHAKFHTLVSMPS